MRPTIGISLRSLRRASGPVFAPFVDEDGCIVFGPIPAGFIAPTVDEDGCIVFGVIK